MLRIPRADTSTVRNTRPLMIVLFLIMEHGPVGKRRMVSHIILLTMKC